jgi:adenosine deaminase
MHAFLPPPYARIELHLHLDCCASYGCVKALAPETTFEEYRRDFIAPGKCNDLVDFLDRTVKMVSLMQSEAALRTVTEDLFAQLAADDVAYAELRFAPLLHLAGGLAPAEVVRIVEEASVAASAATGVEARLILCTLRHHDADESMLVARLAHEASPRGVVVALDIAGDEAGHSLDAHEAAFRFAREHGLRITAHAGEASGAPSVWETLERLQPERIGHGIRSIEDDRLLERLVTDRIHLEVCPTSNVQTMGRLCERYEDHPVAALRRRGVDLSISTDCRTVSNVTLAQEYERLRAAFGWTREDLVACNLAAVRASFAPEELKTRLVRRVNAQEV